jgi:hypothetical protein
MTSTVCAINYLRHVTYRRGRERATNRGGGSWTGVPSSWTAHRPRRHAARRRHRAHPALPPGAGPACAPLPTPRPGSRPGQAPVRPGQWPQRHDRAGPLLRRREGRAHRPGRQGRTTRPGHAIARARCAWGVPHPDPGRGPAAAFHAEATAALSHLVSPLPADDRDHFRTAIAKITAAAQRTIPQDASPDPATCPAAR